MVLLIGNLLAYVRFPYVAVQIGIGLRLGCAHQESRDGRRDIPERFEARYENAKSSNDLTALLADLKRLDEATGVVAKACGAVHAKRSVWQKIGMYGADADAPIVQAERSVWQKIGMYGADADAPIVQAERALSANDTKGATRQAGKAVAIINDSGRIGGWCAGKAGAALFLLLLTLWCCHLVFKQRREAAAASGLVHH